MRLAPKRDPARCRAALERFPEVFEQAYTIRAVEETLLDLFRQGRLSGTVHTCVGQELVGPCVTRALERDDYVVSNHRGRGHFLARTGDGVGLMAELMGSEAGVAGGMGGSQHLVAHRYFSNGIVGGMTPIAAGLAFAAKRRGSGNVVVAFIGDGALGEGVLYESMNVMSVFGLPVVLVLENNGYAQSTSNLETFAGSLAERVTGFGLGFARTSIWDPEGLVAGAGEAISRARQGAPQLLAIDCYRLNAHSKGDDNRSPDEVQGFRDADPLTVLLSDDAPGARALEEGARAQVAAWVKAAQTLPRLTKVEVAAPKVSSVSWSPAPPADPARVNALLNRILARRLESDDRAYLFGEDICDRTVGSGNDYGGAFKVSLGLSTRFPERVKNFPISEAALVGFGTGMALAGMRPIVEIMFGDFMTLAVDQIHQHASKFRRMYADKVRVPLVVRTPMGAKRGYGPTHSQSLERLFLGLPDLFVVALNNAVDPGRVYDAVFAVDDPVIVIENKLLYTGAVRSPRSSGFALLLSDEPFPTARLTMQGVTPDVTVLCHGEMLDAAEEAARRAFVEDEIAVEIVVPTLLSPFDVGPLLESVSRSGRLVVAEEGSPIAAFGSEAVSRLLEEGTELRAVRRVGFAGVIPCSRQAELSVIPDAAAILAAIRQCAERSV